MNQSGTTLYLTRCFTCTLY